MVDIPPFNREDPRTVHDILWAWSTGSLSKRDAIALMELDDELELYEAAIDNFVPVPGEPSPKDLEQAEEFIASITFAA